MGFVSEERKLDEWHRRVEEGRKDALRRERSLTCIASLVALFFVLFVICILGLVIDGIVGFIQCL